MNADDYTDDMYAVPDINKSDRSYDWANHLIHYGDTCAATGNHDYARQMWLEAMSHLDDCYAELGVRFEHER